MQGSGVRDQGLVRRIHIGKASDGGTKVHCVFQGGPCQGFPKECDICTGWVGWGLEIEELEDKAFCRVCGCTEERACEGGCSWVADPEGFGYLCSKCLSDLEAIQVRDKLQLWGGKIVEFLDNFEASFEDDELAQEALALQEEGLNLGLKRIYPPEKEEKDEDEEP